MIRQPLHIGYGWLLLIAIAFFFFYAPIVFDNQVFYCCDNFLINVPAKVVFARGLLTGHVPLWNPYILSGMPFLADSNLSLLFPTTLLFLFLSPFRALSIGILISIFISMMGMFGFVHALCRSRASGVVAAFLWGVSGTMVTYINNLPMLQVIALMPWVLWMLTRYMDVPTNGRFVSLVCAIALSMLGGHPHIVYMTGLLLASWMFYYGQLRWQTRMHILCRVLLYAIALTAVQTLPFMELVAHSTRLGRGFAYASSGSMHPASILRLFLPSITGNDATGTSWILGGSINGYIGLVGLFLAFSTRVSRRIISYFRWVIGISFLMVLGSFTPFFRLAYSVVPGVSQFRSPENYIVLTTFALCVLAGFGLKQVPTMRLSRWRTLLFLTLSTVTGAVALIALELRYPSHVIAFISPMLPGRVVQKMIGLGAGGAVSIWNSVWLNVLFEACIVSCLVWLLSAKRTKVVYYAVILGAIYLELYLFVTPVMITVPNSDVIGWFRAAAKTAQEMQSVAGRSRILTDQKSFPNPYPHIFGQGFWPKESQWQASILRPNTHMLFGLSSPDGYSSTVLRSYQNAVSPGSTDPTGVDFRQVSYNLLKSLGVGGVITTQGVSPIAGADVLVCDGCNVRNWRGSWDQVHIIIDAVHAVMAVSSMTYYPGWRIVVDGIPQDLHTYNGFLSVQIPMGTHHITFRFVSQSVQLGFGLSVIAVLSLLFHLRNPALMDEEEVKNSEDIEHPKRRNK